MVERDVKSAGVAKNRMDEMKGGGGEGVIANGRQETPFQNQTAITDVYNVNNDSS
jgi:hypothetical protein